MTVQSKLIDAATVTCQEFQHPWTDQCVNATAGILLTATPYCLRVYSIVYALSLIMRHRVPTVDDLKRTIWGIVQSSAFLVTNAYSFVLYNCLIRNLLGRYYMYTVAFIPCFCAALTAILIERPARRPLLALYVANVATETLWHMAEARGWVCSIPYGQTLIFAFSVSTLLYLYRLGLHKNKTKDSIFNILRIFVGTAEEGPLPNIQTETTTQSSIWSTSLNFVSVTNLVKLYTNFINRKHKSCAHKKSCFRYAAWGGLKPLLGGVGLQVTLKVLMNLKKIFQNRMKWKKHIFNRNTLQLGIFLGSFSLLYRFISCLLRHSFDFDDARFAWLAGIGASLAFTQYPDNTVALYVMWKAVQLVYNLGIRENFLPHVPHFTLYMYSFFTAVLFHAGILEAKTLRPSYFKFLQAISGERFSKFNFAAFDSFGLKSGEQAAETIKFLNIVDKSKLPAFAFAT